MLYRSRRVQIQHSSLDRFLSNYSFWEECSLDELMRAEQSETFLQVTCLTRHVTNKGARVIFLADCMRSAVPMILITARDVEVDGRLEKISGSECGDGLKEKRRSKTMSDVRA